MRIINYKDKAYSVRVFKVIYDDKEQILDVASTELQEAMQRENGDMYWEDNDGEAGTIDNDIYYYLDAEFFNIDAKEICEEYLDEPMEFLEELNQ